MNKTREKIIQSLIWSNEEVLKDVERGRYSWHYASVPRVYAGSKLETRELEKMQAEGLVFEIAEGTFTITKKGRGLISSPAKGE